MSYFISFVHRLHDLPCHASTPCQDVASRPSHLQILDPDGLGGTFTHAHDAGYKWALVKDEPEPSQPNSPSWQTSGSAFHHTHSHAPAGSSVTPRGRASMVGGAAAELEWLRDSHRQREDQLAVLQRQMAELEATRDRQAPAECLCSPR